MHDLAVTAIGADRPGIVAAVTGVLHERGGNLEDSAMTILGGHFAIVLLVATEDDPAALRSAIESGTTGLDLTVSVVHADADRRVPDATHLLSVYGADKPGIVAGVTAAIAEVDANITDLETQVIGEDQPVYAMVIELVAADEAALGARLEATCRELGVDHTLRTIEAETY